MSRRVPPLSSEPIRDFTEVVWDWGSAASSIYNYRGGLNYIAAASATAGTVESAAPCPGNASVGYGTLATDASSRVNWRSGFKWIYFGAGKVVYQQRIRFTTLPTTTTDEFHMSWGMGDQPASLAEIADGVYLFLDMNNSKQFVLKSAKDGTRQTSVITSVTPTVDTDYDIEIEVSADGTNVECWIDGASVASMTTTPGTNIPNAAADAAYVIPLKIVRPASAGTTTPSVYCYGGRVRTYFSTPRSLRSLDV